jgi:hypothetical protein
VQLAFLRYSCSHSYLRGCIQLEEACGTGLVVLLDPAVERSEAPRLALCQGE